MTVHARASVPPKTAFAVVEAIDLTAIFTGYGPLPAVVGVRDQSAPWDRAGATRIVLLSDGSEAREQLTHIDAPHSFSYRLGPFTGALRRVVDHADGEWWFRDDGTRGSDITWTYTFTPRRLTGPLVRLLVARLWRRYAQRVLSLAVRAAEESG